MRVARAIFHGGPLGESRGVNTRIGAVELIRSGLVGAGGPTASEADDIEENELVLRRSSTRTALAVERVVITFAEMIVAATRSATTPTHIVTRRLRRLPEGIACRFTLQLLIFDLERPSRASTDNQRVNGDALSRLRSPRPDGRCPGLVAAVEVAGFDPEFVHERGRGVSALSDLAIDDDGGGRQRVELVAE